MIGSSQKERVFQEIVDTNRRRILAISRSYAPAAERQDLFQEILLQMWKGLDGFEGRSNSCTWVYRVALNTAITYRRKNGRRPVVSDTPLQGEGGVGPMAAPEMGKEIVILDDFLEFLGKIDRAIFLLYLEDLSYRGISEVTGLTEGHVGVRINRLKRAFIQRYLGG